MANDKKQNQQQEQRLNPIIFVEGYKGGVGKSIVALTLIEYCKSRDMKVAIIDTDTTNPDIDNIYHGTLPCKKINLEEKDGGGWIKIASFAHDHPETIIVSMKAGSKDSTLINSTMVTDCLKLLNRPVNLFFVLGIQKQSVALFVEALELFPSANAVVAVKNLKNGDLDEFFNYDDVKKDGFIPDHVIDMTFPRVHASVSLQLTDDDVTISDLLASDSLRIGQRAALQGWIGQIYACYDAMRKDLKLD
jgi:hypothetical protein